MTKKRGKYYLAKTEYVSKTKYEMWKTAEENKWANEKSILENYIVIKEHNDSQPRVLVDSIVVSEETSEIKVKELEDRLGEKFIKWFPVKD